MEQGNFKAAVRIACSDESLSPNNAETIQALIDKHPTPPPVRPLLFGGGLTALTKKEGGIRSIAAGCVFRRLAAKCANSFASSASADYLAPRQLGVGVKGGAEAAAHSARKFLSFPSADSVLIKIDFKNAFNTIR